MTSKIFMPALSPTMTEGTLSKWLVKVGDEIKAGDILAEIETDKATMEIEAVDEGKVTKILIEEGSTEVQVNSTIAILDGDDQIEDYVENTRDDIENQNMQLKKKEHIKNEKKLEDNIFDLNKNHKIKLKASPYAKKIAKQENIDLKNITGSGPEGRVIKRDLENISFKKKEGIKKVEKPSKMRKIIAERTTLTKQTIPHFYLSIESKVDKLIEMRKKINKDYEIHISINDILVKAIALAQQMNPKTNASWINGKIIKYNTVDVSIAVALNEGLITPIVKNADTKGLQEISLEIKELVEKAKKGKLLPEEYNGGTISISNLGKFGILEFAAIINPPQSSILAVGTIKKTPSVVNNEIKIVNIIKSTLSVDHRILDGSVASKLLKDFHDIIEDPFNLWLMSNDMEII